MAETNLHNYSVQEKLNKMDIDIIDIDITVDADADGEILGLVTEIPNAVAVKGGSAILQSAVLISNKITTNSVDVIITSDGTALSGGAALGDAATAIDNVVGVMDGTCGFFTITNLFPAGVVSIGSKQNIGMVCKAESDSKSLHVWLIDGGSTDWDVDSVVLRLGFIKD